MGNKYYQPGTDRAARVNDLFAAIASRYDLINDLQSLGLHRVWKRRLVRLASPQPGERALDLCCGTGDVAITLAAAGAEVIGLDFSDAMLAVARERTRRNPQGSRLPLFVQGDALQTNFPGEHFDVVTMSYGLRNLASWERGLEEMLRVTKSGGRMLVLDFGKPDSAWWRALYFAYLRTIVPRFGRLFFGDTDTHSYIFESLQNYPAQHGVQAKMIELGFNDVRVVNLLGGVMSINFGRA